MKRGFNNESKTGMKERKKRKWQKTKNTEAIKKKKQTSIIKHIKSLAQEKQNFNKARKNSVKGTKLTSSKQNSNWENVRYAIVKLKAAILIQQGKKHQVRILTMWTRKRNNNRWYTALWNTSCIIKNTLHSNMAKQNETNVVLMSKGQKLVMFWTTENEMSKV